MTILRRFPFTITLLVVLLVVAIVTGPIRGPSGFLRQLVGLDLGSLARHKWWSFVTADFFVDNLPQLLIVLAAAALGVGLAERLMGSRRALVAFLVTGIAASVIAIGVQQLGVLAGEYWASSVRSLVSFDPLSPIFGAAAAASAFGSVLWRRRIRVIVLASSVVFLLYSGQPSDLHRLIAVLVGLLVGALFTRQHIRLERWTSSHHESRVLLAVVAAISALGPIITLVSHGVFGLLSPLGLFMTGAMPRSKPGGVPCSAGGLVHDCSAQLVSHAGLGVTAVILALVPLAIVLVGAYGLLNGRRAAVYLVAAFSAANGVLATIYFGIVPALGNASRVFSRVGQSPEFTVWIIADAVLPLVFAAIVLSQRRHFPIRATGVALRRFFVTVGIALVAASAIYLAAGTALGSQFRPAVGPPNLLEDLPERFIPMSFINAEHRDFVPTTFAARLVYHGVGPLFWLAFFVAVVFLLRGRSFGKTPVGDLAEFQVLMRGHGGSMSFPGTWSGNSYWFDAERRMAIAYRIANGCAVTVSDPVGEPRDRRDSLVEFIRFCDSNAWTTVFYGVHAEWAQLLVGLGWSTTVVAEETVIDPSTWAMTGKKWQDVRSSVNRAAREGVRVTWSSWHELAPRTANQIAEISELWVVEKKLPELGFTLGGLDELRDPDVLLGVASDESGAVQAVTSWMPTWKDGVVTGRTLDFMRRRADGMNGVMEFVIAEAAGRAQLDGLEFLSLSGAPLAVAPSDEKPSSLDRVLAMVGRSLEPVYGFRSLLNFKQKFQPRLVPLHLAYPDAMSLPAIGIAISRCYLPDLTLRQSGALMRGLR